MLSLVMTRCNGTPVFQTPWFWAHLSIKQSPKRFECWQVVCWWNSSFGLAVIWPHRCPVPFFIFLIARVMSCHITLGEIEKFTIQRVSRCIHLKIMVVRDLEIALLLSFFSFNCVMAFLYRHITLTDSVVLYCMFQCWPQRCICSSFCQWR